MKPENKAPSVIALCIELFFKKKMVSAQDEILKKYCACIPFIFGNKIKWKVFDTQINLQKFLPQQEQPKPRWAGFCGFQRANKHQPKKGET